MVNNKEIFNLIQFVSLYVNMSNYIWPLGLEFEMFAHLLKSCRLIIGYIIFRLNWFTYVFPRNFPKLFFTRTKWWAMKSFQGTLINPGREFISYELLKSFGWNFEPNLRKLECCLLHLLSKCRSIFYFCPIIEVSYC